MIVGGGQMSNNPYVIQQLYAAAAAADAADEDAKLWRGAVHRRVLLHDGLSSETPSLTAGFNNNP